MKSKRVREGLAKEAAERLYGKRSTYVCDLGHLHGGTKRDGATCDVTRSAQKKKKKHTKYEAGGNIAGLMGTTGKRVPPKKITGVVSAGLPGTGKKKGR